MVHQAGWLTLVCLLSAPVTPSVTSFEFSGTCDGQKIMLQLTAEDDGEKPEIIAFHVYRRPIALDCAAAERVTPQPIPRESGTRYVLSFLDDTVQPEVEYEYTLVGVDAQAREHKFPYATPTWVGCGEVPIAHGFIEDVGWALIVEPACAVHCNPPAVIAAWPPDIDAWVGRKIPILLYGSIGWSETLGTTMFVSSWRLESCSVGVQETAWGAVKRMYH